MDSAVIIFFNSDLLSCHFFFYADGISCNIIMDVLLEKREKKNCNLEFVVVRYILFIFSD